MTTNINLKLDGQSIIKEIDSCTIAMDDSMYCQTIKIEFKTKERWIQCLPTTNYSTLRLQAIVGSQSYNFLLEDRDSSIDAKGLTFSIWGRSTQALLNSPYSQTIKDTVDTEHPWQTGDTTAQAIITYILANYTTHSVTISWNVVDYTVYSDSFSVNNQTILDVVKRLADAGGYDLTANSDGSLSVEYYSIEEGTSVASYNDYEDIIQTSEQIEMPSGINTVVVYGHNSPGVDIQSSISTSEQTTFSSSTGSRHRVRLYYYHSRGLVPVYYSEDLTISFVQRGIEEITEDVDLTWGKGSTSYISTDGFNEVNDDATIPYKTVETVYDVYFVDYDLFSGGSIGEKKVMFYFSDKTSSTLYNYTVTSTGNTSVTSEFGDPEDAIIIEKESPPTVYPNSEVVMNVYFDPDDTVYLTGAGSTTGTTYKTHIVKLITETVSIVNGTGTLSYPIYYGSGLVQTYFLTYQYDRGDAALHNKYPIAYRKLSNIIKVYGFENDDEYRKVSCTVSYYTVCSQFKITIPPTWVSDSFDMTFDFGDMTKDETLTIDLTGAVGTTVRNIIINIKDYTSAVNIQNASIWIDNEYKGDTGADGLLDVNGIAIGDHTIKITASGFLDSDLDDLANSTLSVT